MDEKVHSIISVVSTLKNIENIEIIKLKSPLYDEASNIYEALEPRIYELKPLIAPKNKGKG